MNYQTPAAAAEASLREIMAELEGSKLPAQRHELSRRGLLKVAGIAGGGLALAFAVGLPSRKALAALPSRDTALNAFVQIKPTGRILIYAKNPDMGQGIKTAYPMIVAEELDAAWADVDVELAPIDGKIFGPQSSGGSRSIPSGWDQMRRAGATARAMLVSAAAKEWKVAEADCRTEASAVIHDASGRRLSYGQLASKAAGQPVPDAAKITLKTRDQYKLLGTRVGGVDNHKVVTGQPLFGIDQSLPGMLVAVYQKCPAVGGKVASANLDHIKAMPGVKDAFIIDGTGNVSEVMPGVAIVAENSWAALKAKAALQVTWDEGQASKDSWTKFIAKARELAPQKAEQELFKAGDVDQTFTGAAKTLKADYHYAFVAHATMEPMNCTAWVHDGMLEMWAPSQAPERGAQLAGKLIGLGPEKVKVHQTRSGGAFGRRAMTDFMCEAAAIAHRVPAPVKMMWTREDDMRHDFYRVGGFHNLEAALDTQGKLVGWKNHFVTFTANGKSPVTGGNMSAEEFPLPLVANAQQTQTMMPLAIPCGPWRAPRSNTVAFAVQSFINELSVAAGRDHLEFLLEIMGEPRWLKPGEPGALHTGRAAGVIKLAAEKAGWGRKMPAGSGLGLAFHFSHAGHFAHVAEISVDANQRLRLTKVIVAGDIGPVVNLSGAEAQVQGSVVDGYSTMWNQLNIENGRIIEGNFDQYPLLRMPEAPVVEVHFIQSDFAPTGVGEPALPPVAPAVANAIFAATGKRIRSLPLLRESFAV